MSPSIHALVLPDLDQLRARFVDLLPRIERHAAFFFRDVRCTFKKADLIAETVAYCWQWFVSLARKGKDASRFVGVLARYAAIAVKTGRKLAGIDSITDVMSDACQRRNGFKVEALPASTRTSLEHLYGDVSGQRQLDVVEERLHDNTRTPPDQQAMFRIDFAAWLQMLTARQRRLVRAMAANTTTKDLSQRFEVSPGRISQMRRELMDDWQRFWGDIELKKAGA